MYCILYTFFYCETNKKNSIGFHFVRRERTQKTDAREIERKKEKKKY